MRSRLINAFDQFIDIRELSHQKVIETVKNAKIDIAIHRNGHTALSKTEIFAERIAPIQINYLGYPGTIGGNFIDYIIGDQIVIPKGHEKYYSEKIISLPDTYQPNDDTRIIDEANSKRSDEGLPDDSFVFCSFTNTYKITPNEFDVWMRILNKVPNSVLWLLKTNSLAKINLEKEANKRGVNPSRIIFADYLEHSKHLERHKHADLFLDTFCVNAHTTASDALWAGLPLVTKIGDQFAARVSASLLTAVGLTELITQTEADFEKLILELANQPERLKQIRSKLQTNRSKEPLFNTKRYARNFEIGLQKAYDLFFEGKVPENITVEVPN